MSDGLFSEPITVKYSVDNNIIFYSCFLSTVLCGVPITVMSLYCLTRVPSLRVSSLWPIPIIYNTILTLYIIECTQVYFNNNNACSVLYFYSKRINTFIYQYINMSNQHTRWVCVCVCVLYLCTSLYRLMCKINYFKCVLFIPIDVINYLALMKFSTNNFSPVSVLWCILEK